MAGNLFNQARVLFHTPRPPGLGPGPRPHVESVETLRARVETLGRSFGLSARQTGLVLALACLWHDRFEAAHEIVQELEDADGNLIHAILHRREPDYWNSKYWWRRVGAHPIFPGLAAEVEEALGEEQPELVGLLVTPAGWDPMALVDACQRVADEPEEDAEHAAVIEVQRIEFHRVLAHLCG